MVGIAAPVYFWELEPKILKLSNTWHKLSSELGRRLGLKVWFKELRLEPKFLNRGICSNTFLQNISFDNHWKLCWKSGAYTGFVNGGGRLNLLRFLRGGAGNHSFHFPLYTPLLTILIISSLLFPLTRDSFCWFMFCKQTSAQWCRRAVNIHSSMINK